MRGPGKRWPFLFLLPLGLAAFTALWYASSPRDKTVQHPAFGGVYTEGVAGTATRLNPLFESENEVDAGLDALVFAGLTRLDDQGRPFPDLADRWDASADGRTYIFHLRDGVRWQDGAPVTAGDAAFTYQLLSDPDLTSPPPLAAALVRATVAAAGQTLTIQLPEPSAALPAYLSLGLLPQHLLAPTTVATLRDSGFNQRPVGAGPFRVEELDSGHALLVPNPGYHFGQPYIQRLEVRFFRDEGTLLAGIRGGQIDGAFFPTGLAGRDLEALQGSVGLRATSLPAADMTLVYLNTQVGALQDARVRRALYYAVDRNLLVSGDLSGQTAKADSPLVSGTWAFSPVLSRSGLDPIAAGALLDDAGWRLDSRGLRRRGGVDLTLNLVTNDDPVRAAVATALAGQWKALGVQVKVDTVSTTTLTRDLLPSRSFDAVLFGYRAGIDPDPYPLWDSNEAGRKGRNYSGFANSRADRLLEDARAATAPEQRVGDYRDFQELFAQELPALPLFTATAVYVQKASVQGTRLGFTGVPAARFWQVQDWYVKTR